MTTQLTVQNLAFLESEQRWIDLLDSAKRFVAQNPPDRAHGWYYQGVAYHELRQYPQATEAFDQAIMIDNSNALFYNAKGLLLKDQRQYERAIQQFEMAADRKPEILNPIINKAQTLSLLNKNEEALAIYNVVLSRYPDYIPALIFKAECLKELGNPSEALATYDQAIGVEPSAADLVFNKGNIFANQGRLDQALECYNKATQLDPEFPDAYYHVGLVHQRLGRRDEALANFQRAMQQNSATPMARIAAAELYIQNGDPKQALSIMEEAVSQYPNSPFSHYNTAIMKLSQGNVEGSSRDFVNTVNQLDEPEVARKQLLRIVADNEHELVRVSNALGQKAAGNQRILINYPSLVEGLFVKKENQGEIGSNLRTLKTRIQDLEGNAELRKKLDAELITLQQSNPALFDYTTAFMRMEHNFLHNSNFDLSKSHVAPTGVNFLRNARDYPALDYYSWGDQAAELIINGTNSPLSKGEFAERTAASLIANKAGYDPEETHFQVSQAILAKVHSSDQKNREIINYETNEGQKRFVQSLLDRYPKLKTEVTTPSTAIALKDFVILNNYLASNAHVTDFSRRSYEQNFALAITNNLYEQPTEANMQGDLNTFGSFKRPQPNREMTVTVRLQNTLNATSGSEFYVSVNISYIGKLNRSLPPNNAEFPEVYRSSAKPLRGVVEYEFDVPEAKVKTDRIDSTFFRVLVLKRKKDGAVTKKGELWVAVKSITNSPVKIGEIKQKKRFSSKQIEVLISGFVPQ